MAKKSRKMNGDREPTIQEQREAIKERLRNHKRDAAQTLIHLDQGFEEGLHTQEEVDNERERLEQLEQDLLEQQRALGIEVEVGGESYATERFNDEANPRPPRSLGAATPSDLEQDNTVDSERDQGQSREELLKNLNQSTEVQDHISDQTKNAQDFTDVSKDKTDLDKDHSPQESQSREELLRNLNQSAETPDKATPETEDRDHDQDSPEASKDISDPDKGDDELGK